LLVQPLVLGEPRRDVALNPLVPFIELTAQSYLLPTPLDVESLVATVRQ
jgi:hypothetical protein